MDKQEAIKIKRTAIQIMNGRIPKGKLSIIYYYIFEENNYHTLNNKLTAKGKFGAYSVDRYPTGVVYSPKAYGTPYAERRFKQYKRLTTRIWED